MYFPDLNIQPRVPSRIRRFLLVALSNLITKNVFLPLDPPTFSNEKVELRQVQVFEAFLSNNSNYFYVFAHKDGNTEEHCTHE